MVGTQSECIIETFGKPKRIVVDPAGRVLRYNDEMRVLVAIRRGEQLAEVSEFGDALIDGDCFGEEAVADENLGEALEVVDGLESLALADVKLADGHQSDLVAGLVL